jgi:hypothetical protein
MKTFKSNRLLPLFVTLIFVAAPLCAQNPRSTSGSTSTEKSEYEVNQVPEDAPSNDQLIKLLREQNRRLLAENAKLKAEIARLKAQK